VLAEQKREVSDCTLVPLHKPVCASTSACMCLCALYTSVFLWYMKPFVCLCLYLDYVPLCVFDGYMSMYVCMYKYVCLCLYECT
jgi:hypothetical protein